MTMNAIKPGVSALINGKANPVFIAGIKYNSLFEAGIEHEAFKIIPSYTSLCKALKKSGGEPCKVRRYIVVLESWVINRVEYARAAV